MMFKVFSLIIVLILKCLGGKFELTVHYRPMNNWAQFTHSFEVSTLFWYFSFNSSLSLSFSLFVVFNCSSKDAMCVCNEETWSAVALFVYFI